MSGNWVEGVRHENGMLEEISVESCVSCDSAV